MTGMDDAAAAHEDRVSIAEAPRSDDERHREFSAQVIKIVSVGLVALFLVWVLYAAFFWRTKFSGDPASWGQFGDFVGGVANPILSFFTLFLLALTLVLQSRQLQLSRQELELSRKELRLSRDELSRSAKAQENSEAALKSQVEVSRRATNLAATNHLLEHYKSELLLVSRLEGLARRQSERAQELERRKNRLESILNDLYHELTADPNHLEPEVGHTDA